MVSSRGASRSRLWAGMSTCLVATTQREPRVLSLSCVTLREPLGVAPPPGLTIQDRGDTDNPSQSGKSRCAL